MSGLSRRTSDQASLPPPSYRSQPPSYHQTYPGLSEATNSPNELLSETEPVEVEVPPRRPKVFVYYKVFTPDGAIPCKEPVNPRNPYLGRIEAVHIAPPQTVASLIRCILKTEGHIHSSGLELKLFEASSSLAPMEPEKHLSPVIGIGLGCDPRKPLALVMVDLFDKRICATEDGEYVAKDATWLSLRRGDVLHTDGIRHMGVKYSIGTAEYQYDAYRACDKSGRIGYVYADWVKLSNE